MLEVLRPRRLVTIARSFRKLRDKLILGTANSLSRNLVTPIISIEIGQNGTANRLCAS